MLAKCNAGRKWIKNSDCRNKKYNKQKNYLKKCYMSFATKWRKTKHWQNLSEESIKRAQCFIRNSDIFILIQDEKCIQQCNSQAHIIDKEAGVNEDKPKFQVWIYYYGPLYERSYICSNLFVEMMSLGSI